MRRLWGRFKRFVRPVTERYERGGDVIIVRNSRRTFKGESYEEWLVRLELNPKLPHLNSLYWHDYIGRGFGTPEEEAKYLKSR